MLVFFSTPDMQPLRMHSIKPAIDVRVCVCVVRVLYACISCVFKFPYVRIYRVHKNIIKKINIAKNSVRNTHAYAWSDIIFHAYGHMDSASVIQ